MLRESKSDVYRRKPCWIGRMSPVLFKSHHGSSQIVSRIHVVSEASKDLLFWVSDIRVRRVAHGFRAALVQKYALSCSKKLGFSSENCYTISSSDFSVFIFLFTMALFRVSFQCSIPRTPPKDARHRFVF